MKLFGILGLICIITGIVFKSRKNRNFVYIIGGVLLLVYSIHIGDTIFIILQIIFTLVAVYDLIKNREPGAKTKNI